MSSRLRVQVLEGRILCLRAALYLVECIAEASTRIFLKVGACCAHSRHLLFSDLAESREELVRLDPAGGIR